MDSMTGMTGMSMTSMAMTASSTASSAMSSSTSSMDMSSMDSMDMDGCQVSMLWNWNTIGACFLSKSWHITSRGMFAGSCIGVICLVLVLEFLRRLGREYDAFIVHRARLRRQYLSSPSSSPSAPINKPTTEAVNDVKIPNESCCANENGSSGSGSDDVPPAPAPVAPQAAAAIPKVTPAYDNTPFRPSILEQFIRALLHMLQFAVAYFVMLLAMYFNGYIIICIFIGAFLGAFIFSWEPISLGKDDDALAVTKCCG